MLPFPFSPFRFRSEFLFVFLLGCVAVGLGAGAAAKPAYAIGVVALLGVVAFFVAATKRVVLALVAALAVVVPTGTASNMIVKLPLVDIGWVALFGLIGVAMLPGRASLRKWNSFYFSLAVAVIVSLVVALLRGNYSLEISRGLILLLPVLSFGLAECVISSRRDALMVANALCLGVVIYAAFICFIAVYPVHAINSNLALYWQGETRLYFHNSYLLAMVGGAFSTLLVSSHKHRGRFLVVVGLVLTASVLSVTRQVAALTVLCVVAGVFIGISQGSFSSRMVKRMGFTIVLVAIVIAAIAYTESQPSSHSGSGSTTRLVSRFVTLAQGSESSTGGDVGRYQTYELAWRQDTQALPFGGGIGMLFENPWSTRQYNSAHYYHKQPLVDSLPLAVLGKLGVLGMLAYALLFFAMWQVSKDCYRYLKRSKLQSSSLPALLALFATPVLAVNSLLQSFMMNSAILVSIGLIYASANYIVGAEKHEQYR